MESLSLLFLSSAFPSSVFPSLVSHPSSTGISGKILSYSAVPVWVSIPMPVTASVPDIGFGVAGPGAATGLGAGAGFGTDAGLGTAPVSVPPASGLEFPPVLQLADFSVPAESAQAS